MDQTGAVLKKIRLEKGISLEEVQKKTKIHPNILKAIEGDSLTNLSPIYLKGFLKIYCNFLGVDPKPYTSQVKPEPKKEPRIKTPAKKAEGKKALSKTQAPAAASPVFKQGAVVLKKLGARLKKISAQGLVFLRSRAQTIKRAVLFLLSVVIILFVFSSCVRFVAARYKAFKGRRKSVAAKIQKQPVKIPAKPVPKITPKPSAPTVPASPSESAAKAVVPAAESKTVPKEISPVIRLGVRAKGNCWVSVKVDGKIVFQRTLEKGRFESWQAKDRIELSVGNAAAVELEVNGQVFSNLGRKGQALKNILITKDGLKTAP